MSFAVAASWLRDAMGTCESVGSLQEVLPCFEELAERPFHQLSVDTRFAFILACHLFPSSFADSLAVL